MSVTSAQSEMLSTQPAKNTGLVARVCLAVFGASLAFSAFALWLTPGASAAPELSLMKLGVSVFMLIAGMSCLIAARPTERSRGDRKAI